MHPKWSWLTALALFVFPYVVAAQSLPPAANLAQLVTYPTFYTDRTITLRGHLRLPAETTALPAARSTLFLEDEEEHRVVSLWKSQERPEGTIEVTGQLWDLGRMKREDIRLADYDVTQIATAKGQDWPRPGEVFVFAVQKFAAVDTGLPITTIRSVILEGPRATGRLVTVVGQFRGRNLFGDLPKSPGNSRSDFVLSASAAAIWISGLPPKGKDFDLDPTSRVDTNQWLSVTGTVREGQGLTWIEAKSISVAAQPTEAGAQATSGQAPVAPGPPPEVLFSVPTEGETDVSSATTVRIQLSRDLDVQSIAKRVRVSYLVLAGTAATTAPQSTVQFDERERVMTIRFDQPLERFKTVRVQLMDGIKGIDGQALKPWELTFTVGGR